MPNDDADISYGTLPEGVVRASDMKQCRNCGKNIYEHEEGELRRCLKLLSDRIDALP